MKFNFSKLVETNGNLFAVCLSVIRLLLRIENKKKEIWSNIEDYFYHKRLRMMQKQSNKQKMETTIDNDFRWWPTTTWPRSSSCCSRQPSTTSRSFDIAAFWSTRQEILSMSTFWRESSTEWLSVRCEKKFCLLSCDHG